MQSRGERQTMQRPPTKLRFGASMTASHASNNSCQVSNRRYQGRKQVSSAAQRSDNSRLACNNESGPLLVAALAASSLVVAGQAAGQLSRSLDPICRPRQLAFMAITCLVACCNDHIRWRYGKYTFFVVVYSHIRPYTSGAATALFRK
jgi:hypothetical protein